MELLFISEKSPFEDFKGTFETKALIASTVDLIKILTVEISKSRTNE